MSDIDAVAVDSLKALDPKRPIREADIKPLRSRPFRSVSQSQSTWPRYPHWQARNTQHLAVLEKRRIAEIVEEHVGCVVAPKKVSASNEAGNAEYPAAIASSVYSFSLFLDARLRYPLICVGNS